MLPGRLLVQVTEPDTMVFVWILCGQLDVYKLDVQRPASLHLALVELLVMCVLVHLASQLYCYCCSV
jgi:hypothetical protein